jgi:glycosyltransferase involved in cell wall biosynthesis
MIIGIDNISPGISTNKNQQGGMRSFLADLVEGLPTSSPELQFILFTPAWGDPLPVDLPKNCCVVTCPVPKHRAARAAFEQFVLPRMMQDARIDLWLGTCNTLPPSRGWKSALIIQSLQYFTEPRAFGHIRRTYLQRASRLSIARANILIALSAHSRDELQRVLRVDPARVAVIYHWLPRSFRLRQSNGCADPVQLPGIQPPYVLCVSAFYRYKNILRLIEAFALVRQKYPSLSLVLAGSETSEMKFPEIRDFIAQRNLDGCVVVTGRVDDKYMPALYGQAAVVAMPSLSETFGLPVLEALHYGRPVVTSLNSPMAEMVGSSGALVEPRDVHSIAEGILRLLFASEFHDPQKARKEADRFAYAASMQKYAELFRELLAGRSANESFAPAAQTRVRS